MKLPLICPEKECCRGKKDCTPDKRHSPEKETGKKEGFIPLHA